MRAGLGLVVFALGIAPSQLGCSAGGGKGDTVDASGASGGNLNLGGSDGPSLGGSAGSLSIGPVGGSSASPVGPCDGGGWRCQVPDCTGQDPTSIRATVYDPAGVTPLYNVAVYVPNSTVEPIATGASCETC